MSTHEEDVGSLEWVDEIVENAFGETESESTQPNDAVATEEEAPSEEVQADEPVAAQPKDGERERDDRGRFVAKQPEDGQAEEAPAPEGEPSTEQGAAEESPQGDPFVFKADGQEYALPGSVVGDDGVFIPKDQVSRARDLLSLGVHHQRNFHRKIAEKDAEIRQATERATAQLEAANAGKESILTKLNELMVLSERDPDAVLRWFEEARVNLPRLKAEAEAKERDRLLELRDKELETYRTREEEARVIPQMQRRLAELVVDWGGQAGLPREAVVATIRKLAGSRDVLNQIFPKVDGKYQENLDIIRREVEFMTQFQPRAANQAAVAIVKGKRGAAPRPSVSGKGKGSPPATTRKVKMPTTAAEADAFLTGGKYNELFD